jgi:hypothetical protein
MEAIENIKSPTEESLKLASTLRDMLNCPDRAAIDKAIDEGLYRLLSAEGDNLLDALAMLVPAMEMVQGMADRPEEFTQDWAAVAIALMNRAVDVLEVKTSCGREAFSSAPNETVVH